MYIICLTDVCVFFPQDDGILVLPTVADPPLSLDSKKCLRVEIYDRNLALLSISSMSGCCQVKSSFAEHIHLNFQLVLFRVNLFLSLMFRPTSHWGHMMITPSRFHLSHSMEQINFFLIQSWICIQLF